MPFDFHDKTVLVTGAASGIGLAIARAFLDAGARVLATDIDEVYMRIGVCPQFDILWPSLTVTETLQLYCSMKGIKSRYFVRKLVDSVNLSHVAHRFVGRLSGGMKRRVSLAISLVGDPAVVFLDEPTTGLDPETKRGERLVCPP